MINVDPLEIDKFSELAHRWWDPRAEFRPLHDINPLRLDYIDGIASLHGKAVLDVGCGGGILAESMAARGAAVTGIALAENRSRWPNCICSNPDCKSTTGLSHRKRSRRKGRRASML